MFSKTAGNEKGFSLVEILIGVAVFSLGMLGIIALQISSLNSIRFAGNMGEGMSLASTKIEELMLADYDDPLTSAASFDPLHPLLDYTYDGLAGLDNNCHSALGACAANADGYEVLGGWNGKYVLFWNVVENNPINDTKTINMIISWRVKDSEGSRQQVSFTTVREKGI
jgi:prepilin-type N-terminal cleavage/methylation domain-containing protein